MFSANLPEESKHAEHKHNDTITLHEGNSYHRLFNLAVPRSGKYVLTVPMINALNDPEVAKLVDEIKRLKARNASRTEIKPVLLQLYAAVNKAAPGFLTRNRADLPASAADPSDAVAKAIAEDLYQKWLIELDLTADDIYNSFKKHIDEARIRKLSPAFIEKIKNIDVDPDDRHFTLMGFLPDEDFIETILANQGRDLTLAIESLAYDDLRRVPASLLLKNIMATKKRYPQDEELLNKVLAQTAEYIKDPAKNHLAYSELSQKIQRRSWGKMIGGAILAVVGVTLIGLCCATGVGAIAAPVLALGLAYLVTGAVLGSLGALSGPGFFSKGKQENERTAEVGKGMRELISARPMVAG